MSLAWLFWRKAPPGLISFKTPGAYTDAIVEL